MKFLVLIAAVLWLLWLVRGSVRRRMRPPAGPGAAAAPPQPMLRCAQCGLHLPRDEALPGRGGVFCGEPHRALYERAHPSP